MATFFDNRGPFIPISKLVRPQKKLKLTQTNFDQRKFTGRIFKYSIRQNQMMTGALQNSSSEKINKKFRRQKLRSLILNFTYSPGLTQQTNTCLKQ